MTPKPLPAQTAPQADRDMQALYHYLLDEAGETIANRMQDAVAHTLHLLCHAAPTSPTSHVRQIPVSRPFGNWLLFYTPTPTHIRIERVLHGAQNWSSLFP